MKKYYSLYTHFYFKIFCHIPTQVNKNFFLLKFTSTSLSTSSKTYIRIYKTPFLSLSSQFFLHLSFLIDNSQHYSHNKRMKMMMIMIISNHFHKYYSVVSFLHYYQEEEHTHSESKRNSSF